jgi:hypothetical protein
MSKQLEMYLRAVDEFDKRMAAFEDMLKGSGMYGEKIEAPEGVDLQTKLLAVFGRQA